MKSTIEASALETVASPTEEEQTALVQRVVRSSPFRRSARLRDFLLYVAAKSLRDPHAELNEGEIGEKVFGRASSYDRSQDNIVRVNATELRRRIDQYFADEGAYESLVLEIPRGGYRPVFRYRPAPDLPAAVPHAPEPLPHGPEPASAHPALDLPSPGPHPFPWLTWIWAFATAVLLILCASLWQANRTLRASAPPATGPTLRAFWNSFARNHQPIDIVLPDDSASVVEDITHRSISLQDYFRSEYIKKVDASGLSADRRMDLDEIASHDLITFGDMEAAHQVAQQLTGLSVQHLTLSRYYSADAMKRNNLILIGGRKANPWVRLLDDRMNFVVDYDYTEGHAVVLNMHPRPGEQPRYIPPASANALTGYSVVSYLPNPSQNGRAVVLAGIDADSTSAAADFITSEAQMDRFRQSLHVKEIPFFEVLLRTSRVKGTAFNAEVVAYRSYPDTN